MRLCTSRDGTPGFVPAKYALYPVRCSPTLLNYIYHQSLVTHSRSSKSHNRSPVWGLGKVLAAELARLRLRGSSLRMAPLPRAPATRAVSHRHALQESMPSPELRAHSRRKSRTHQCGKILSGKMWLPESHSNLTPSHLAQRGRKLSGSSLI